MSKLFPLLVVPLLYAALWTPVVHAEKKTVCTITVNSADEKDTFRRYLPPDKFHFVELDTVPEVLRPYLNAEVITKTGFR